MAIRTRTFSAAGTEALDQAVNEFLRLQTVDGRSVRRTAQLTQFLVSGGTFYLHLTYEET